MPTKIPYLTEVWQPVTGCSPCSPGCENCYAATMAQSGRLRNHRWYKGLAKSASSASGMVVGKWTGEVRCNEDTLEKPLRWRKPRVVGICFMGDLFHPDVPFAFLDKVFAVMALCPQHTFVICTKRAERMRFYLNDTRHNAVELAAETLKDGHPAFGGKHILPQFPLPNVHLGVTVESRKQDFRALDLATTPAAHRWLSVEPMLGPLDLSWLTDRCKSDNGQGDRCTMKAGHKGNHKALEPTGGWDNEGPCESPISTVIIGCESGPNRRPCKLEWVRQVVEGCAAAGVACYVKQLSIDGKVVTDMAKFPTELRVRELAWETDNEQ